MDAVGDLDELNPSARWSFEWDRARQARSRAVESCLIAADCCRRSAETRQRAEAVRRTLHLKGADHRVDAD